MPLHVLLNLVTGELQERVDWGPAGPPELDPGTLRRWLLDEPPAHDPATQRRAVVFPIPAGAASVPYAVSAIPAAEIALRDKEANNGPIRAQIVAKERVNDRRERETLVQLAKAILPANDPNRTALEAREAEFAALRATLTP